MATLYQFKDYLEQRAQTEIPNLLLNYLNSFYPSHFSADHHDFHPQMIEHFYCWLLYDLHHRLFRSSFSQNLLDEIQPFFRNNFLDIEFEQLKPLLTPQIIPLEKKHDILGALETYYQTQHDSIRTLSFTDQTALVLKLKSDGRLEVYLHSDLFLFRKGQLRPLPPLSCLYYTPQFEFEPLKAQRIFEPPDHFFQFYLHYSNLEVTKFHAKNFSKIKTFHISDITEQPHLFLNLKKIENHYIKAGSDPYYQELIQSLQSCYQMLIARQPQALQHAKKSLEKAQIAMSHMYPHDRLLTLLTANIEYRLKIKSHLTADLIPRKPDQDPSKHTILL